MRSLIGNHCCYCCIAEHKISVFLEIVLILLIEETRRRIGIA